MKRKLIRVILVSCILCLLAGCLGGASAEAGKTTIVVWSFTYEMQGMIEAYYAPNHPEIEFQYEVIPTDGNVFTGRLENILSTDPTSAEAPDIFVLEAAFAKHFVDSDFTGSLADLGFTDEDYKDVYPAALETGRNNATGEQKALSWQTSPTIMLYRSSLAEQYLDVHSPEEFQEKVKDWDTFLNTARELNTSSNGNCKIVTGTGDLLNNGGGIAWIKDGSLNVGDDLLQLTEVCKAVDNEGLTRNDGAWSGTWYAGISGEVETMTYILPMWGVNYVITPGCVADWDNENPDSEENIQNATENGTYGDWRAVVGPASVNWGGSWIGTNKAKINASSAERKNAIKDVISFFTLDKDFLTRYGKSSGDFVSSSAAVSELAEQETGLGILGGQELLPVMDAAAKSAHTTYQTEYDDTLNRYWQNYVITPYTQGDATLEDAIADYKSQINELNYDFSNLNPTGTEQEPRSGTCGNDLTWELTDEGELNISGTGDMYNYQDAADVPWAWAAETGVILRVNLYPGVTSIGDYAFIGCDNLYSISVPYGVTRIGEFAFQDCTGLTYVTLSQSIEEIGVAAFQFCQSMEHIAIPTKVTYLGYSVFQQCQGLKSVTIPVSMEKIDKYAFYNCNQLETVNYAGTAEQWADIEIEPDDNQYLLNAEKKYSTVLIDSSGSCGAEGDNITWTLDEYGVLTLSGSGAMADYGRNDQAPWRWFTGNTPEIHIADGITRIGDWAFRYVTYMPEITIPASVTSIGENAFEGCIGLQTVHYTGKAAQWDNITISNGNECLLAATLECELPRITGLTADGVAVTDGMTLNSMKTITYDWDAVDGAASYGFSTEGYTTSPGWITGVGQVGAMAPTRTEMDLCIIAFDENDTPIACSETFHINLVQPEAAFEITMDSTKVSATEKLVVRGPREATLYPNLAEGVQYGMSGSALRLTGSGTSFMCETNAEYYPDSPDMNKQYCWAVDDDGNVSNILHYEVTGEGLIYPESISLSVTELTMESDVQTEYSVPVTFYPADTNYKQVLVSNSDWGSIDVIYAIDTDELILFCEENAVAENVLIEVWALTEDGGTEKVDLLVNVKPGGSAELLQITGLTADGVAVTDGMTLNSMKTIAYEWDEVDGAASYGFSTEGYTTEPGWWTGLGLSGAMAPTRTEMDLCIIAFDENDKPIARSESFHINLVQPEPAFTITADSTEIKISEKLVVRGPRAATLYPGYVETVHQGMGASSYRLTEDGTSYVCEAEVYYNAYLPAMNNQYCWAVDDDGNVSNIIHYVLSAEGIIYPESISLPTTSAVIDSNSTTSYTLPVTFSPADTNYKGMHFISSDRDKVEVSWIPADDSIYLSWAPGTEANDVTITVFAETEDGLTEKVYFDLTLTASGSQEELPLITGLTADGVPVTDGMTLNSMKTITYEWDEVEGAAMYGLSTDGYTPDPGWSMMSHVFDGAMAPSRSEMDLCIIAFDENDTPIASSGSFHINLVQPEPAFTITAESTTVRLYENLVLHGPREATLYPDYTEGIEYGMGGSALRFTADGDSYVCETSVEYNPHNANMNKKYCWAVDEDGNVSNILRYEVTAEGAVFPESISLPVTELVMECGSECFITPVFSPADTNYKRVYSRSSDREKVEVSSWPDRGVIMLSSTGAIADDVVITISAETENGETEAFELHVSVVADAFGEPDFTLPAAIKTIEESAFEGGAMSTVYIPDGCTLIGENAFKDSAVQKIRIPDSCAISDNAFDGCACVYVFGEPGSPAEEYCDEHTNCIFITDYDF